ncbi:MAG: M24 family metallopeptidase [Chlorobi bacterium]|nr:M24 family metallopeptidase [Chlorobiota bacterium]
MKFNIKEVGAGFYIKNRERLYKLLPPRSTVIIHNPPPANATADLHYEPYEPDRNLFYLTGLDLPNIYVLLCPDYPDEQKREIIFYDEPTEVQRVWEGEGLYFEDVKEISGVPTVLPTSEFRAILQQIMFHSQYVFLNLNENERYIPSVNDADRLFASQLKNLYPAHEFRRLAPILAFLRNEKQPREIEFIKKAVDITRKVFLDLLPNLRQFNNEAEVEGFITGSIIAYGGRNAFPPIVAGGKNATVLHYSDNNKPLNPQELLLLDFGAQYLYWNADMTRVVPYGGNFSPRQKEVYNAVLKVQKELISFIKPGLTIAEIQAEAQKLTAYALVDLKLMDKNRLRDKKDYLPIVRRYFPHGFGHFIGLDVHEQGYRYEPLRPSSYITCEPGIYIREEGIGVRLENDLIITETGVVDLMENVPIEPEEIEDLINS